MAVDHTQLSALALGQHDNPFAVLGPHADGKKTIVHTFQPHAKSIVLIDAAGKKLSAMRKVHDDGIFAGSIASQQGPYRFRMTFFNDDQLDVEDPYRFSSPLGELDLHLLGEGNHHQLYQKLGAHLITLDGVSGTHFALWAPNASRVSVVGDFNDWDGRRHIMRKHPGNGIWDIFIPSIGQQRQYKFELLDSHGKLLPQKSDPLAQSFEGPPGNASRVYQSTFAWSDDEWMQHRDTTPDFSKPISVYEVHLGSWRRKAEENNRWLSYRELAEELVSYVVDMGYTHIELLPITEHPFDGSWGYQPIGLFAPTYRFGEPDDFRFFVNACHKAGIAVIFDWVPAHFPRDEHGLGRFDGTALYEHPDPRRGEHSDWGTLIFNYGSNEVRNYLLASALYWVKEFHIDGLRVDAVASMLYLDYSRKEGEWLPNEFGGNENLEAVSFLRRLNEVVHAEGAITFAEESTSWPKVTRPTYEDGLGFTYKWNMGWMNDTLSYIEEEPIHRKYHHDKLTFGLTYAFSENFLLPLSHDEVVHGKRSLLQKMPGDDWQRFANLRAYLAFTFTQPGKKLLFMGSEIAQYEEWNHNAELNWASLKAPAHHGVQKLVRDLNKLYRHCHALHDLDVDPNGFEWIDLQDRDASIISWLRKTRHGEYVVCVANFTPVVRHHYRIGIPDNGGYKEILNTDAESYGGSGIVHDNVLKAEKIASHNRSFSLTMTLPPLAMIVLERSQ